MREAATGSLRKSGDAHCRFRPITGGGFRAALEVTRRCDLHCAHCFVPQDAAQPDRRTVEALVVELGQAGCRKLLLTGGEPLLRADLETIVESAQSAGLGVDLNSNLVGLDAGRADRLVAAGLREASASFYGDASFHDAFVGRSGAYEATCRGCALLRERGVDLDVHGPLWRANLGHIHHVFDLARQLGASSLTFFRILDPGEAVPARHARGSGAGRATEFPLPAAGDLGAAVERLRRLGGLVVRTVGFREDCGGECEQGRSIIGVDNRLALSPCLLSRRSDGGRPAPRRDPLSIALQRLRREVQDGLWRPVCNGSTMPAATVGGS